MSVPDRRAKLDRDDPDLSIRRQCRMLGLARSGVCRRPFLGSRRMVALLAAAGVRVNRKRVQRLMRLMGVVPLGPKPRTSKPGAGHKIFP